MLEIHTTSAGRGAAWLLEGFDYFKTSAGVWIGIGIIMIIVTVVSAVIPLASLALQFLVPVFIGGLVLGCREISNGGKLEIKHLFAGFSQNTGNLILLSVLYFIGIIIIGIIMFIMLFVLLGGMEFFVTAMEGDTQGIMQNSRNILLVVLIALMLYIPLLMAFWFAPALIVLSGQGAIDAMKYSFAGCLKNIIPFLIYGLVGLVLSFLASIPLMLGWFVLMPMMMASIYIAYKDIYQGKENTVQAQA